MEGKFHILLSCSVKVLNDDNAGCLTHLWGSDAEVHCTVACIEPFESPMRHVYSINQLNAWEGCSQILPLHVIVFSRSLWRSKRGGRELPLAGTVPAGMNGVGEDYFVTSLVLAACHWLNHWAHAVSSGKGIKDVSTKCFLCIIYIYDARWQKNKKKSLVFYLRN